MGMVFVPNDRIGLRTAQKSIPGTFAALNDLLRAGADIGWHIGGLRLEKTSKWPEGHYYQCGFSLEAASKYVEILAGREIFFEEIDALPRAQYRLRPIKIALYSGNGADAQFARPLIDVLKNGSYDFSMLDDGDIRRGRLETFDVMVVPGSPDAGECYYSGLGDMGYDKIRDFVANYGCYLGICGGAYLPLSSCGAKNPYWLGIVDATDDEDLDYWRAGSGFVRCRVDDADHPVFSSVVLGSAPTLNLIYWEGPSIRLTGRNVRSLARFESLLASGKDPLKPHWDMLDNVMAEEAVRKWHNCLDGNLFEKILAGRCAFAEASYGKNKLLLYSPHPEMGNFGSGPWAESLNFLLIYNGLNYLSAIPR
jgi:hypothetical protein